MNISEYQLKASRTMSDIVCEHSQNQAIINGCFGLIGESGELIDHFKKHIYHGHNLDIEYIEKELGDILWYINSLASACEIEMDKVAKVNIEKLMKRYPEGFSEEMSRNRVEYEK